jgi:hypothetical protein
MESFWLDKWWAIPLWVAGAVALGAVATYAHRNPEAKPSKVFFFCFPGLDPNRKRPPVARWAVWLVLLGLLFVLVADLLGW